MENPKVLIATIGTGRYACARYVVAGSEGRDAGWPTEYSPVATARLLLAMEAGERARALILCTPEAREKHFEAISFQLRAAGCDPEAVEIGMGQTPGEQFDILGRLAERIPKGARITADFTLSLRHLGLAFVAALGQLVALRDAVVETVAYGAFELRDGEGNVPLVDATPLFRLIEWSQAARAFAHRGDLAPLHEFIRREGRIAHESGDMAFRRVLARLERPVGALARAEHSGLPLETGLAARELLRVLGGLHGELPEPMLMIVERLHDGLGAWAVPEGVADKGAIVLDRAELRRELRLVEHYLKTQNPARALRLLREWLVNLVVERQGRGAGWLDFGKVRKPAEQLLNILAARKEQGEIEGELVELGSVWSAVRRLRNNVAHAAFTADRVSPTVEKVANELGKCHRLLKADLDLDRLKRGDHLLVTPLGMSPGVLYTALTALEPDRVLVVTSPQARENMEEAARRAGSDAPLEVFEIQDPLRGYLEADGKLREEQAKIEALLASCGRVTVNLTGGTTLLGWVAGEIGRMAGMLVPSVRRVALVDDRPPEEQRENPWVAGEVLELQAPE